MPANNPEAYSDPDSPHYDPKKAKKGKKKSNTKFPVRTDRERQLADAAKMALKDHK